MIKFTRRNFQKAFLFQSYFLDCMLIYNLNFSFNTKHRSKLMNLKIAINLLLQSKIEMFVAVFVSEKFNFFACILYFLQTIHVGKKKQFEVSIPSVVKRYHAR